MCHAGNACGRHGPAFGNAAAEERDGDPLCEVLAAAGRRCSLADRPDVLSRHVTGALSQPLDSNLLLQMALT